jgi:dihydrofolate reductase
MRTANRHPLVLVAAVARNGVIGAAGRLPWHLPSDLARFRSLTWGHPLLMGRVTWQSIGRPLPGRTTTVLSRTGFHAEGAVLAPDLPAALASADRQADNLKASAIMVVGGSAVYAATIGLSQTLLITEVDAQPAGDTFFPVIDPQQWIKTGEEDVVPQPGDQHRVHLVRWQRRP